MGLCDPLGLALADSESVVSSGRVAWVLEVSMPFKKVSNSAET